MPDDSTPLGAVGLSAGCPYLFVVAYTLSQHSPTRANFLSTPSASLIPLNPYHLRVPKMNPRLELFSSKGGTFEFQGRNFLVPAEELSSSKAGTFRFLGYFFLFHCCWGWLPQLCTISEEDTCASKKKATFAPSSTVTYRQEKHDIRKKRRTPRDDGRA